MRALLSIFALIGTAAPAHAAWQEATSAHFVVLSDDAPERVTTIATRLERFDRAVRILRKLPDDPVSPSSRVTLLVVRNESSVSRLAQQANVAGFYSPRAIGPVAFTPKSSDSGKFALTAETTLFHEYAHHLMFTSYGDTALPAWIVEGYAEFHATAKLNPMAVYCSGRHLITAPGVCSVALNCSCATCCASRKCPNRQN